MNEHEDEDTHPERPQARPASMNDDLEVEESPVEFALGSRPALDLDAANQVSRLAPSSRAPFVVTCHLGGKQITIRTDGTSVSLVLMKSLRIDATRADAVSLAKALLRAASLIREPGKP